jgi:two-component system OmpR family response regulator
MRQDFARKVLVVDGDAVVAALLAQLLRTAGFEAVTARTGEAALALMIEQRDGIGWLVTKAALPGLVCGRVLADEFSRWHPASSAVVLATIAPMQAVETLKGLRAAAQARLLDEPPAVAAAAA